MNDPEFESRAAKIRELLEKQAEVLLLEEGSRRGVVLPEELLPTFIQGYCDLTQISMMVNLRTIVMSYGMIKMMFPNETSIEVVKSSFIEALKEYKRRSGGS